MMTKKGKHTKYNYDNFNARDYNFKHFGGPRPGEKYVDFEALTVDGELVKLSDYLDKPVVLDTGSITCPMYANAIPGMHELKRQYPNIHFLLLYVREAHPGGRVGGAKSIEEKLHNARSTCLLHHESRDILVDTLNGNAHIKYGGMPNMTYVIGTDGIVKFRANWTNVEALKQVLENLDKVETKDYYKIVKPPIGVALRTLMIGGFRAIVEFVINLPQLLRQHKEADKLRDH